MRLTIGRYWQFLASLFVGLVVCELVLSPIPVVYQAYSSLIGYVGLSVEAILPIPQILVNYRSRSSQGLRISVLASWLVGDSMKMFWFFTSKTTIPWAFKLCGMFQAVCDSMLGVQYVLYGQQQETVIKEHQQHPMHELQPNAFSTASGPATRVPGRRTSTSIPEKTT